MELSWLLLACAGCFIGKLTQKDGWCYSENAICWLEDKAPESIEELRRIRALSGSMAKAYRLDAEKTVASYLNRSFLRSAYRGRPFLVEHKSEGASGARIFVSFDDSTHMAFELEKPCFDGCRDIWVVKRYAYLDENPNCSCD